MRAHVCIDMRVGVDLCVGTRLHKCVDTGVDMRVATCANMCVDKCVKTGRVVARCGWLWLASMRDVRRFLGDHTMTDGGRH